MFAYFVALGANRGDSYGRLTLASLGDSNERNYLTRNKDVAAAVAEGIYASGLDHFIFNGYAEGRGDFDSLRAESLTDPALGKLEAAYLQQNRDVARAVVNGQFGSGLAHFLIFGGSEGRRYGALQASLLSSSGLEAAYIAGNSDAVAEGALTRGVAHYLAWGYKEGRQAYGRLGEDALLKSEAGEGVREAETRCLLDHADVLEGALKGRIGSGFEEWRAAGAWNGRSYGGVNRDTLLNGMNQDADRYVNEHSELRAYANRNSLTASERTELATQHFVAKGFEHGETLFGLSQDQANTVRPYNPDEIPNLPLFGTLGFQPGAIPGAIAKLLEGDPRELFALTFTLGTTDGFNCGSKYNNGKRGPGSQSPGNVRAASPFDAQCNRHDCVYEEALGDGTDKKPGKIKEAENDIRDAEDEIKVIKSGGTSKFGISYWQDEITRNKAIIAEPYAKVRVADITLAWIAIKDAFTNLGQSLYAPLEAVYKLAAAVLFTAKAGVSLGMTILEHLKDDALKVANKLWEGVTGVVKDFWTLASDAVSRFVGAVRDFFSEVGKTLETIAETVGSIFDRIGQAISDFFGGGQSDGNKTTGAGDQTSDSSDQASDDD